jgi:hypothetical protein
LIVLVCAIAFTFVTIWVLIFRFTPNSMSDVQREVSFSSNGVSVLPISLPESSVPSAPNASPKHYGWMAEDLASNMDQVQ